MTLNTGDEYIRLSGTIRPDDIDFDNTIASNCVSNARIQYSGTGVQQDMQEPGFWHDSFMYLCRAWEGVDILTARVTQQHFAVIIN